MYMSGSGGGVDLRPELVLLSAESHFWEAISSCRPFSSWGWGMGRRGGHSEKRAWEKGTGDRMDVCAVGGREGEKVSAIEERI